MLDLHGSFVKWDDLRRTCILAVIYCACHWYWQCWQSSQDHIVSHSCSPPFNGTRWVAQEGVILSKCRILHDMTFWPQMSYYRGFSRKKASSNVNYHLHVIYHACHWYWHCWQSSQDHIASQYCSPLLMWQVGSREKVSYYPNVVFCIIWHFGLKCRTIEVIQEKRPLSMKMSFCIYNEATSVWNNIFFVREICSQHQTIWSLRKIHVDVFTMSHTKKVKIHCLLMIFFYVGDLTSCSISL